MNIRFKNNLFHYVVFLLLLNVIASLDWRKANRDEIGGEVRLDDDSSSDRIKSRNRRRRHRDLVAVLSKPKITKVEKGAASRVIGTNLMMPGGMLYQVYIQFVLQSLVKLRFGPI